MSADSNEMVTLIQRLRDQAALTEVQDSLAISCWSDLWQKRLVTISQDQAARLYEPRMPRLAELVSAHQSDDVFIERAYQWLTGRSPDPGGEAYYRKLAAYEGRLSALVAMLQSREVDTYIHQQQIQLPAKLCRLNRWYQYLSAIPVIGLRFWSRLVLVIWRRYKSRWQVEAEQCQLLAHEERRHQTYQTLALTLTEMAEMQALIVSQLEASSVSSVPVQQARDMADMLKTARQVLRNAGRESA